MSDLVVAIGRVGQASERFHQIFLKIGNCAMWLLATTLHIYMSDSLLLSHILKSIRYVTREELVAAMEKVTQGLREEIRSFFQAFSCGWHHQYGGHST